MPQRYSHGLQFGGRSAVRDRSLNQWRSIDQSLKCWTGSTWLTLVYLAEDDYARKACMRIVLDGGVKEEYSYQHLASLWGTIGGSRCLRIVPSPSAVVPTSLCDSWISISISISTRGFFSLQMPISIRGQASCGHEVFFPISRNGRLDRNH